MRFILLSVLLALAFAGHDEYVEDMICAVCPETSYCVDGQSFPCPQHSLSDPSQFPSMIEDCVCIGGYHWQADTDSCDVGQPPFFYVEGYPILCPANMLTVDVLASASTDCVCSIGYEEVAGECRKCTFGTFKGVTGNQSCAICPAGFHADQEGMAACVQCGSDVYSLSGDRDCRPCMSDSTAPAGSESIDDCVCDTGYARLGTAAEPTCLRCEPGTKIGETSCVNCPISKFSTDYGQDECQQCPANTSAYILPRTSCQCDPGYRCREGDVCDGDCVSCPANTWADTGGWRAECSPCQANSVSPEGSSSQDMCQCTPGYFEDTPHVCVSCPSGTYFNGQSCVACEGDYVYTPVDSNTGCISCPLCPDGYYDSAPCQGSTPSQCELCPANTSTRQAATMSSPNIGQQSCICDESFYGELGGPCFECPFPMVQSGGAVDVSTDIHDCMCPRGMFFVNNTCDFCLVGSYKDVVSNDHSCTSCAGDSTTIEPGAESVDECLCPTGQFIQNNTCTACPEDTYKDVVGNTTSCLACHANSVSNTASIDQSQCLCRPGWFLVGDYCEPCQPGTIKDWIGDEACAICAEDTFEPDAHSTKTECDACPMHQTTNGGVGSAQCLCIIGFEINATDNSCEPCSDGSFRASLSQSMCVACSECPDADTYIYGECNSTTDTECRACPPNTNLPYGYGASTSCNCNAGYELIEGTCQACSVGKYRSTDSNNSIMCVECDAGKNALSTAVESCTPCASHCPDANYVSSECSPVSAITCSPCTTCPSGNYSRSFDGSTDDTTCGPQYLNGRTDTDCSVCEEGFYCQGGVRYWCGVNGTSGEGSSVETQCSCEPSFYREDNMCKLCHQNEFCVNGTSFSCPPSSYNHFPGGSHVTDCNCFHFYYRTNVTELTFTCEPCQPGDACYDASYYSCPDSRHITVPESSFPDGCVCIDGYFNTPENTCAACPEDFFCYGGNQYPCPGDRWTQSLQFQVDQSGCLCMQGTYDDNGACKQCLSNSYCPGDNFAHSCPSNSVSPPGSTELHACECSLGFQNTSYPDLTCVECVDGSFKSVTGNEACEACKVCSAAVDQEYEKVACTRSHDAVCDACDPCEQGVTFIQSACQDKMNTVCTPCSDCSYDSQWRKDDCKVTSNTVCEDITFNLACEDGEYRGQHTQTSDSFCSPCSYRDKPFFSTPLHQAKSYGLVYNDPYSCRIRCLGVSKLRDLFNHSLGCISCETGNVLLKTFTVGVNEEGDDATCSFTCKPGYDRILLPDGSEDCVVPALPASVINNPIHYLAVSNFEKIASGFRFTVVHSNHSRFVLVVGPSSPRDCNIIRGCCYGQSWRVSTLRQAGFPNAITEDGCSKNPLLLSTKLDESTLTFEINDTMIPFVATCAASLNEVQECRFVLSLVDTILWSVTSQEVAIQTRRASQHVAFIGLNQYIPLDGFDVEVLKAYEAADGVIIYLIKTRIQGFIPSATMRVSGMTQVTMSELRDCVRLQVSNTSIVLDSNLLHVTDTFTEYVTYWSGNSGLVSAYYTLNMADGITQDIVAVRDMSEVAFYCSDAVHVIHFNPAHIMATSGLGAAAVYQLHSVAHPTHATYGELGTLLTYVVRSTEDTPVTISLQNLLAVYTKSESARDAVDAFENATILHQGNLDFSYAFRQLCRAQSGNCAYEYLLPHAYDDIHFLRNCSDGQKTSARDWISRAYGVVHDAGHVDAMCARMLAHPIRSSLGLLVQTQHFLDRTSWMPYMDSSMADIRALIWVNFKLTA